MVFNVQGKVAVITGGSAGFGEQLAQRLSAKGCRVVLLDVNAQGGKEVAAAINKTHGPNTAAFIECNVANLNAFETAFNKAVAVFQRVDIMVNNAGIAERQRFIEDPNADWKTVMDIDLYAVIKGTQLALNQFRQQSPHGGVIINVASMAGFLPDPNMPIYVAAKMGVVGLTRSLSWKLYKTQNVRVNGIAPTFAMTNLGKFAAQDPAMKKIVEVSTVPVSLVIDAFMRAIEDESLAGDILRITAQKGIDVLPKRDMVDVTPVAKKTLAKL
ncbi:UNVERIFIED_CONTAM: hypothetical protein HDU68_009153 [Siphonaria sp. JEL0065]|nr:hypothetical protein HDU68_009153 [Siphonaria sp. JEL0065]